MTLVFAQRSRSGDRSGARDGQSQRELSRTRAAWRRQPCHGKDVRFMGDPADVAASRFVAAVRRGHPDLCADALDGRAARRRFSLRRGRSRPDVALREPKWPRRTMQAANSFSNQFELPVLFYVLTILVWVTRHAGYAVRHPGVDFRHLPRAAGLRARDQQQPTGGAVPSTRSARWCCIVMWAIYIVEVLSGGIV